MVDFAAVRASVIDQRTHNVFYRQTQLERLCRTLIEKASEIRSAIESDYGHSQAEAAVEVHQTIDAVKRDYASLQPKKAIEEEYLVATKHDAPDHRRPVGMVYIEPCKHTLFYSAVAPLSAAIAAGNCTIVLLESNLRTLSSLLRRILPIALDNDTFAIASSPIIEQSLLDDVLYVNQNSDDRRPRSNQLASISQIRTIAVVDRTANIQLAAQQLVLARLSFGGSSPYAPDVVFVNEFVKAEFLRAVSTEFAKLTAGAVVFSSEKGSSASVTKQVAALQTESAEIRVHAEESKYGIVETLSRKPAALSQKISTPILKIHAIRSLDDAIDLISSTGSTNLAAYHFGNAGVGKYLSQYVDAALSTVNNIPPQILVGPAFPTSHPIDPLNRYPQTLFSEPRPVFVQSALTAAVISKVLSAAAADQKGVRDLFAETTKPFVPMKRSEGGGVGFFEQGFLFNAGFILTTVISVSGGGIYWLVKHGRPLW